MCCWSIHFEMNLFFVNNFYLAQDFLDFLTLNVSQEFNDELTTRKTLKLSLISSILIKTRRTCARIKIKLNARGGRLFLLQFSFASVWFHVVEIFFNLVSHLLT